MLALLACKKSESQQAGGTKSQTGQPKEEVREVKFVWVRDDGIGGISPAKLALKPNPSGDVRVGVYEEFSGGGGETWRATMWMASFLASSTLGRQMTEYEFDVSAGGFVDGPSAGALMTATLMSAIQGTPVKQEVTITGTVNPDGSIGPVGGIPQKLQGAAGTGIKTFGYPVGQRQYLDESTQQLIDIHELAQEKEITIKEVRDIYDAYELLTGQKLARPVPLDSSALEISSKMSKRMQSRTSAWNSRTESRIELIKRLRPEEQYRNAAESSLNRAKRYQSQDMTPAAYDQALQAAVIAEMNYSYIHSQDLISRSEYDKLILELKALVHSVDADLKHFQVKLETEEPKSPTGTVTLIHAHESVAMAWAAMQIAEDKYKELAVELGDRRKSRTGSARANSRKSEMARILRTASEIYLHYTHARLLIESADDVLELDSDSHGRSSQPQLEKISALARTYTSAAKANLDFFLSLLNKSKAETQSIGVLLEQTDNTHEQLFQFARKLLGYAFNEREKRGAPAALATLASAQASYLLSARLITEFYSLGVTWESRDGRQVADVWRDKAFISMLKLAEQRALEMAASAQDATGAVPASAQRAFRTALVLREGDTQDKLRALMHFWSASIASQTAAALGQSSAATKLAAPITP